MWGDLCDGFLGGDAVGLHHSRHIEHGSDFGWPVHGGSIRGLVRTHSGRAGDLADFARHNLLEVAAAFLRDGIIRRPDPRRIFCNAGGPDRINPEPHAIQARADAATGSVEIFSRPSWSWLPDVVLGDGSGQILVGSKCVLGFGALPYRESTAGGGLDWLEAEHEEDHVEGVGGYRETVSLVQEVAGGCDDGT